MAVLITLAGALGATFTVRVMAGCTPPAARAYEALRTAFPGAVADSQDGLRLSWPDRWVHVRPSGTEPIVRVIAEAPTDKEALELVRRSRAPLDALGA